jgi:hypothetical protein
MRRLIERGAGELVTASADLALDVGLPELIATLHGLLALSTPEIG